MGNTFPVISFRSQKGHHLCLGGRGGPSHNDIYYPLLWLKHPDMIYSSYIVHVILFASLLSDTVTRIRAEIMLKEIF